MLFSIEKSAATCDFQSITLESDIKSKLVVLS